MGKLFRVRFGFLLIAIGLLLKAVALIGGFAEGTTAWGKEPVDFDEDGKPRGAFSGDRFLDL